MNKRVVRYTVILLVAVILLGGCSRKGVHMSKHRKNRRCNCPTFAESTDVQSFDSTRDIQY